MINKEIKTTNYTLFQIRHTDAAIEEPQEGKMKIKDGFLARMAFSSVTVHSQHCSGLGDICRLT